MLAGTDPTGREKDMSRKLKLLPIAALVIAFAFALYGCGGNQQKSEEAAETDTSAAAQAETSAAPEAAAAEETSAAPEAEAAEATASDEVNPELVAACEELGALVDEYAAVVDQAIEANDYKAYEEQIDALSDKITGLTDTLKEIAPTDANSADMAYYKKTILPIVNKFADKGFELIDLIMGNSETE